MTVPLTKVFPTGQSELNQALVEEHSELANAINGSQASYDPYIEGTDPLNKGTYTSQLGNYFKKGLITDVWFTVTWSAHADAGTAMKVSLPQKVKGTSDIQWIGSVMADGIAYTAGAHLVLRGIKDTFFAEVVACTNGGAVGNVVISGTGTLAGNIRYIGQADRVKA